MIDKSDTLLFKPASYLDKMKPILADLDKARKKHGSTMFIGTPSGTASRAASCLTEMQRKLSATSFESGFDALMVSRSGLPLRIIVRVGPWVAEYLGESGVEDFLSDFSDYDPDAAGHP